MIYKTNYYTLQEVADRFRVSKQTIYQLVLDGKMRGTKIARIWRISESDIEAYLKKNSTKILN